MPQGNLPLPPLCLLLPCLRHGRGPKTAGSARSMYRPSGTDCGTSPSETAGPEPPRACSREAAFCSPKACGRGEGLYIIFRYPCPLRPFPQASAYHSTCLFIKPLCKSFSVYSNLLACNILFSVVSQSWLASRSLGRSIVCCDRISSPSGVMWAPFQSNREFPPLIQKRWLDVQVARLARSALAP